MKTSVRRTLALAISWTMVVSTPVHANPTESSGLPILPADYARELGAADEYHRQYADLEKAGEGQPKSALAPDRFLLMEQTAYPKAASVVNTFLGHTYRKWKLASLTKKTRVFLRALEKGRAPELDPKVLTHEELKKEIYDQLKDGRRVDTPLFLWTRRADRAQLENIMVALADVQRDWSWNERANFPNETNAPVVTQVRNINWWDVKVQVRETAGDIETVKELPMKDTARGVSSGKDQPYFCAGQSCTFSLVKDKSILNVFGIKSQVVATFDQFVVFTHADSYDSATGTQYLSFLDLGTYNGLIGNESIPVFRLPLKIDEPIRSLTMSQGRLVLNEKFFVEREYLEQASEMQQVAFNLQANLIDPNAWANVIPLVDSAHEFFDKTVAQEIKSKADERDGLREATVLLSQLGTDLQDRLNAQKLMKPMTEKEHNKLGKTLATVGSTSDREAAENLELYHKRVSDSATLAKMMDQTQDRVRTSRKFGARVRLLAASLMSPRPNASQKIKEALGGWFVRHKTSENKSMLDRLTQLADRPFVDVAVISAAALRLAAPETFGHVVDTGLSFSLGIADYMVYAIRGTGDAFVAASQATFSAFYSPIKSLGRAYVENGNWWRTLVGVGAFTAFLGALYFVPHFLFNLAELVKDMRKPEYKGFVDRQMRFDAAYYKRVADEEGVKHSNEEDGANEEQEERPAIVFTAQENADIQAWLRERYAERDKSGNKSNQSEHALLLQAALEQQAKDLQAAVSTSEQSPAVQQMVNTPEDAKSFWWAFKHFAISMPALELTLERWAGIWNWWASWRFTALGWSTVRVLGSDIPVWPMKLKPIATATRLLYPEFLNTSIFKNNHKGAVPSEINGGLRPRCSRMYQRMCRVLGTASAENVDSKKQLESLKAFEDQIIKAEEQVTEVAFRAALAELPKFMNNPEDLKKLFNSKSLNTITQQDILGLSWSSKTFLRAYYESVYEAGMVKFLNEMLGEFENTLATNADAVAGEGLHEVPVEAIVQTGPVTAGVDVEQENAQRTSKALKELIVNAQAQRDVDPKFNFKLEAARNAALSVVAQTTHLEAARAAVKRGQLSWENFKMNNKFDLVSNFDPKQNKSMERVAKVHKRLESPGALGRALRAEISKLKLTLPIELTFKLVLSAGITSGAMVPVQNEIWGENSTFYLSHTSFYMMMASGFFMSIMADAWGKLQEDARQDEMGQFGKIPQGEDATMSFMRWYQKQFMAQENSLMSNWQFSNYVAFWNMPAALANISLFYFMFSGRIDLSLLATGYVISFGTPFTAMHYKIDQAFERAAHYAARGIKDPKWLAHPDVQKFLIPEMQRYRDHFTIYKDIYANVAGNFINNLEMVPTDYGHRGLARSLGYGTLMEEGIVNGVITPLHDTISPIPVVGPMLSPFLKGCELLLTNGNPDLTKLRPTTRPITGE